MFTVVRVPDDAKEDVEQLGKNEKFWFIGKDGKRYLYRKNYQQCGNDWAEKIACELCRCLEIPHAEYELAVWRDCPGVITRSIVPEGGRLVLGNELLPVLDPKYPGRQRFGVRQHTVGRVIAVVGGQYRTPRGTEAVRKPLGATEFSGVRTSVDFFVGYLMLDALIANNDRHHENWALLVSAEPAVHLAQTFDHGSALGMGETDENRRERLTTKDRNRSMAHYVTRPRARSPFYRSHGATRALPTLDSFVEAARRRKKAGKAWLQRLRTLSDWEINNILQSVPAGVMSLCAREFAKQILLLNRARLLAVEEVLQ